MDFLSVEEPISRHGAVLDGMYDRVTYHNRLLLDADRLFSAETCNIDFIHKKWHNG